MAQPALSHDLVIGQTLGHYHIIEKIGAGGMGEVYRARDHHLDREVAIKVLAAGTLSDEASRKQFHKEAIALSRLNHPNIATIHDFDTQQGVDFLVMEYIPGITLSEKLAARPLPENDVVSLGVQLAEGLSAAHEHGVIHRDLKPGNLRVASDGRLKILDFGLAKLRRPVTETAATESFSDTQAMAGTLPYMAPEQLLGEEIDARTDIHAAGSVLYEMATGQRPFADVEYSKLIGAILRRSQVSLTAINPKLTPELERIVDKCLEKEPENRYQTAKELAIDLRRLQTGVLSTALPVVKPTTGSFPVIATAKQHEWSLAAGLFVLLVVLGSAILGVYSALRRHPAMPFQNFTITQVTNSGKAARAAISPDGRYVLSVMNNNGMQSLWLRNVPTGSDTQVIPPSASNYRNLAFSPDGNYIYFRKAQNDIGTYSILYRSPVFGGTPQLIVQNIDSNFAFSPDGQQIAYVRHSAPDAYKYSILTASLEGKNEEVLHIGPFTESPGYVAWSPSGDEIFYPHGWVIQQGVGEIEALDLRMGKSHPFATFTDKRFFEILCSPDRHALFLMYWQKGANWFRGKIGILRGTGGEIEPITRDTNQYINLTLSADGKTLATVMQRSYATVSVLSETGGKFGQPRLLLSQSNEFNEVSNVDWMSDGNLLLSSFGRLLKVGVVDKGQTQILADSDASIISPSSCGANYAVLIWAFHSGTNSNVWRINTDGSSPLKLTDGMDINPVCSPDQKWVYYIAGGSKGGGISRVLLDGSGKKEVLWGSLQGYGTWTPLALSPDGRMLADIVNDLKDGSTKIALFQLGSSSASRIADASHFSGSLKFTPDGKSLAYTSRKDGIDNIWVDPLDGSPGHAVTDFKSEQIWSFSFSPDGTRLAVLRGHWDSDVVLLHDATR